jgi:hypothetical protein
MEFPSGWLVKEGKSFRNWMKRWVQFDETNDVLLICDRPGGRLKRTVRITSIESVGAMPESKKKFAFAISERRRGKPPATINFYAESKDSFDSWFGAFARCVECNKRALENVRRAILCFLAIRKFRRDECEHVGTVCKDVMGIIVAMIWESRSSESRIWRF